MKYESTFKTWYRKKICCHKIKYKKGKPVEIFWKIDT